MKAWEQVQIEVGEYVSKKNKSTLWAKKNNQRNMHVFEAKLFENIDKPLRNRQRITNERTLQVSSKAIFDIEDSTSR